MLSVHAQAADGTFYPIKGFPEPRTRADGPIVASGYLCDVGYPLLSELNWRVAGPPHVWMRQALAVAMARRMRLYDVVMKWAVGLDEARLTCTNCPSEYGQVLGFVFGPVPNPNGDIGWGLFCIVFCITCFKRCQVEGAPALMAKPDGYPDAATAALLSNPSAFTDAMGAGMGAGMCGCCGLHASPLGDQEAALSHVPHGAAGTLKHACVGRVLTTYGLHAACMCVHSGFGAPPQAHDAQPHGVGSFWLACIF